MSITIKCSDCGGSGTYVGFVSTDVCRGWGGYGTVVGTEELEPKFKLFVQTLDNKVMSWRETATTRFDLSVIDMPETNDYEACVCFMGTEKQLGSYMRWAFAEAGITCNAEEQIAVVLAWKEPIS